MSLVSAFWLAFGLLLTFLVVAAGVRIHARRQELIARDRPRVDDDAIRTILERGSLEVEEDEPLDLDEIDEEEERFWSESWDEPEEWPRGDRD